MELPDLLLGILTNLKGDEASFDTGYASEPMATFEPMVRLVLRKD